MWLRIVAARRVGVHLGVHGLADGDAAVQLAAMDDQPADRPLRVLHGEQDVAARVTDDAAVADLAAAFGVERRHVQDQLRVGGSLDAQLDLRLGLELLVFGAVAQDGHDLRIGGGRLVADERRVAGCRARSSRRAP